MATTRICADIVVGYTENYETDIRPDSVWEPVSVADYLFRRLTQLKVGTVHGVTGDANRQAIEYAESSGLKWIEHYSALGAGYAADGYARIKGISALMTTYGTETLLADLRSRAILTMIGSGELCALNAIAAAHAEHVPIVHIVGMPSTRSHGGGGLLHSPFGHGDHGTFANMHRPLSCVCAILDHPAEAAVQIDDALRECWVQSRPVYLGLPVDVVHQLVDGERLKVPIDLSLPANDPTQERYVAEVVLRYLNAASSPIILVDAGVLRHRTQAEVHELVAKSGVATFVSPMAKGAVDETLTNYCGIYSGSASEDAVRDRVESADLVLSIGCIKPDFVTPSGLVYLTSGLPTIHLYNDRVCVRYSEYRGISMKGLILRIADDLHPLTPAAGFNPVANLLFPPRDASLRTYHDSITHLWFWQTLARWLKPYDVVVADGDIPTFGLWGVRSTCQVTSVAPTLWNSDGYGVPASQGAAMAMSELVGSSSNDTSPRLPPSATRTYPNSKFRSPQTILLTTPCAFQTAAPELSVLLAQWPRPVVLILCAAGDKARRPSASSSDYNDDDDDDDARAMTPEPLRPKLGTRRAAKSPGVHPGTPCLPKRAPEPVLACSRRSNQVGQQWRYHELFTALGAGDGSCQLFGPVRTRRHLTSLFGDGRFGGGSAMQVAEIEFGIAGDAPAALDRAKKAYSPKSRWTQRPGDA